MMGGVNIPDPPDLPSRVAAAGYQAVLFGKMEYGWGYDAPRWRRTLWRIFPSRRPPPSIPAWVEELYPRPSAAAFTERSDNGEHPLRRPRSTM